MRQLLRRFAVTALLAPVAAVGATTMIASPAEAAPAKPGPTQPDYGQYGSWYGSGNYESGRYGSGNYDSGRYGSGNYDSGRYGSWNPGPGQRPSRPAPTTPAPTTPAPSKPAPTTPAPGNTTPAKSTEQALQDEVNRLINVERGKNGCSALTVNDQLTKAARDHSAWMAQTGTFSHTGSGGSSFVDRAKAAGYAQPSAENIAYGYRTASEVVNGWMNSPGHRTNIVNCKSKTVGVGVVFKADGTPYYTQDFGY